MLLSVCQHLAIDRPQCTRLRITAFSPLLPPLQSPIQLCSTAVPLQEYVPFDISCEKRPLSQMMTAQLREPGTPAKVITRPRTMFTPRTTVPRPALANHNDNVPAPESPSRLSPAPGAHPKLKIKSTTTPEARQRMLVKPKATPLAKSSFRNVREEEDDVWGAGTNVVAVLDAMEPAPKLDEKETVLVTVR